MKPVRITVLRYLSGLAPSLRRQIDVRPVELGRFPAPAWDRNQKPDKVPPDRLPQTLSCSPEPRVACGQITRSSLRCLRPASAGDLGAGFT